MFIINLLVYLKIWLILELVNWISYLIIYINIVNPKYMEFKEIDTQNIINRVDKLKKEELKHIIGGCIIYNKITHSEVNIEKLQIENLTKIEIINLIGFSLFGLNINDINLSEKYNIILKLVKKIELILECTFKSSDTDRYLYRKWGSNFIKFSFRPLILQLPLKIFILSIHILFTYYLGFKWEKINKIGFLSKNIDINKKNIIFIHGLGFGYVPYFRMLMELDKKYNLIIIVLPNISSYNYYDDINYSYFPPLTQISNTLYNFLESKKINKIIILAHSFGTYITEFIRRDFRSNIFEKIILVDPIIFWIGYFKMSLHIENPFIKKYPITTYLIDNLLCFMIYQCLYLKYVCFRVMFGPDFWIYDINELKNKNITIILEKEDYVIPAELLYQKIKDNIKCHYFDSNDMTHGTILMKQKYLSKLINIIDE